MFKRKIPSSVSRGVAIRIYHQFTENYEESIYAKTPENPLRCHFPLTAMQKTN
jgi:hypothetical protein